MCINIYYILCSVIETLPDKKYQLKKDNILKSFNKFKWRKYCKYKLLFKFYFQDVDDEKGKMVDINLRTASPGGLGHRRAEQLRDGPGGCHGQFLVVGDGGD